MRSDARGTSGRRARLAVTVPCLSVAAFLVIAALGRAPALERPRQPGGTVAIAAAAALAARADGSVQRTWQPRVADAALAASDGAGSPPASPAPTAHPLLYHPAVDEISLEGPFDAHSTQVAPGVFPHAVVNASCPRFVRIEYHDRAGLGHRLSNLGMALVAAFALRATLAYDPLDYVSNHGNFTGADAFLGLGDGEMRYADVLARYAPLARIALPRLDGYRKWRDGGPFSENDAVGRVWVAAAAAKRAQCGVLYEVSRDDWIRDPKPAVKWVFAQKWARHEARVRAALDAGDARAGAAALGVSADVLREQRRLREPLWDPADVNVAVHVRQGDITPTRPEWHAALLTDTVLPVLVRARARADPGAASAGGATTGPRVRVHVFFTGDTPKLVAGLARPVAAAFPSVNVTLHGGAVPALRALWHLTRADVLLEARSSFSEYAGVLATRPLAFAARGARFAGGVYEQCGVQHVCCDPVNATCPPGARARLEAVLRRRGLLA